MKLLTRGKLFFGLLVTISTVITACGDLGDWSDGTSYTPSSSGSDADDTEDLLMVSENGEDILIEYNEVAHAAILNWDDGDYYFSPDPEGKESGDKIICAVSISDYTLVGDCFRSGQVCHFTYYDTYSSDPDKDAYYASSNSCKKSPIGPFLVPLNAPKCGEDPYPACPSEDIFPDGPADKEEVAEEPTEPETAEVTEPEVGESVEPIDPIVAPIESDTTEVDTVVSPAPEVEEVNAGEEGTPDAVL